MKPMRAWLLMALVAAVQVACLATPEPQSGRVLEVQTTEQSHFPLRRYFIVVR